MSAAVQRSDYKLRLSFGGIDGRCNIQSLVVKRADDGDDRHEIPRRGHSYNESKS
jgi:hypothetical protein